jgi:import inner membrane translocase subunit TIM50
LKAYDGKDIPIEYAKKEEESKRAAIEEWERKNPNRSSGGGGFLGGMFGSVSAVCSLTPYSRIKEYKLNINSLARRDQINP